MSLFNLLKADRFDWLCISLLVPITFLAITPSSYGIALNLFGYNGEGLLWGTPRPIRSDEWSVWTPYLQMSILNNFGRFNELSTYHQDLRGFNALPLQDWALIFKPFMWPFWLLSPARAFALHHGLIIMTFLIGWKNLTLIIIKDLSKSEKNKILSSAFSLLLFFTGFVQFWWTTLGPILALSPWLLLLFLRWKNSLSHYICLSYVATVWLLSHTYPPIIISIAYFGILLLYVHQPFWWRSSLTKLTSTAVACLVALTISLIYYSDAIPIMMETVYPGQRISQGGERGWLIWLSTLVPYITHSYFDNLVERNICNVGAISSLLPLVAVCFVKPNTSNPTVKRAIIGSAVLSTICTIWMLLPVPALLAKITLLYKVPGLRMLFLCGLTFNYLALVIIVSGKVAVSKNRCALFTISVIAIIGLPSLLSLINFGEKSVFELSALAILYTYLFIYRKDKESRNENGNVICLLIALVPNVISFSWFNPGQSAFPIFDLHKREEIKVLKETAHENEPNWIVSRDYRGAILSGMGLNSFVSVLIQPQLELFRSMYPAMPEDEFNYIFNRYGRITLSTTEKSPNTPFPDVISIPLADLMPDINDVYSTIDELPLNSIINNGGHIDAIAEEPDRLVISGWAMSKPMKLKGNMDLTDIFVIANEPRPDVSKALNDSRMLNSGFEISIERSQELNQIIENNGLCIFSSDSQYGLRALNLSNKFPKYRCKW
ncbi:MULTISPECIES: hypothetical protein [unclassified Vibrio]|uniref:DUF7657 domain-containing protein n=1 Tax=unclassified Vibrio TaxID=2614977 RepID=UPI002554D377|nr:MULTISPECIES: hypothetical protein [unclassified Vibrio]MDK9778388.1 hypothetical protein [Vibrio sp. D401a]MDK9802785.1 hypothetical protein [Vibrio sp. D406a]